MSLSLPAVEQAFPTTPSQHAELLHPLKAKGEVFVGRKLPHTGEWDQASYHPWELEAVLDDLAGEPDVYMTQNRFKGRRKVLQQCVRELAAVYVDVDYYEVPELAGLPPEAVLEMALERLAAAGIPEPSLALCSGKGLTLAWRHTPVAWKELLKWQDCQKQLWRVLKPLGSDSQARDAARLLRVVGTTNSKNSGCVYALRDAGPRQRFAELTERILPAEDDKQQVEASLHDIRVQRAARREYKAPRHRSERSLWLARWVDLQTLRRLRYGEEQMDDFRDRWLFLAGVAMSWITDPPEPEFFERELLGVAEEWGGWDEEQSTSKLQAVLDRVRMVTRGEKVTWEGMEVDARYRYRTQTIIDLLQIEPAEEREMFNLIGEDEKRRRNTQSRREKRRIEGARPHDQYKQLRRASLQKKCATARHLRDHLNLSNAEIAAVMGVCVRTVRRWIN